jgi:hypothetical protein
MNGAVLSDEENLFAPDESMNGSEVEMKSIIGKVSNYISDSFFFILSDFGAFYSWLLHHIGPVIHWLLNTPLWLLGVNLFWRRHLLCRDCKNP